MIFPPMVLPVIRLRPSFPVDLTLQNAFSAFFQKSYSCLFWERMSGLKWQPRR